MCSDHVKQFLFLSKNHKSHLFFTTPRLKIQFSAIYNFNWWDFPIHIQEQQLRALNTQNFFTVAVRQACHHRDTIKFSEFIFWNYQLFWKHVCFFFSFLIENLLIINTRKWQIISSDLKLFVNLSNFLFFNCCLPATMTRNRCFFPSIVCNQSSTSMTLHSCLVLSTSGTSNWTFNRFSLFSFKGINLFHQN